MTVTLADIHAVAQRYLTPDQRIVGWFDPLPETETDGTYAART
jgi:hypothetical protein